MRERLQQWAMAGADRWAAVRPRPLPEPEVLQRCKIIAHRGAHDNVSLIENTLDAFRRARTEGVFGIECDIRWTADLVPVIHHDTAPLRTFGDPRPIASYTFAELRARHPRIPSLGELVSEFGGNTHLMLELKQESLRAPQQQAETLAAALQSLGPALDYHLLALSPQLFDFASFAPRRACLPVAELNVGELSRVALAGGLAGLSGHYLLLRDELLHRHREAGQLVGTGFIASRNGLFRELNRGVDWIFSDHAVQVQGILDEALRQSGVRI